jgi:hypothetical protein
MSASIGKSPLTPLPPSPLGEGGGAATAGVSVGARPRDGRTARESDGAAGSAAYTSLRIQGLATACYREVRS